MHQPNNSSGRILDVALDLFAVHGYDRTSIREICEAAGITRPTLYYFFGSKEGVYRALVEAAMGQVRRDIEYGLKQAGTVSEQFKHMARRFFAGARSRPKLWRFIFAQVWAPATSEYAQELHRFYTEFAKSLGRVTRQAVARRELAPGPTPTRVLVLMGAMAEALSNHLVFGRPELTPELADSLIDTILNGWTADVPSKCSRR